MPLIAFQLAWIIAFNDRLFDPSLRGYAGLLLNQLLQAVADTPLTLDSPREQWVQAIKGWLQPVQAATS
ncbi:MAG: hypothetical protein R3F53_01855 [Gammaproteobacteria bacterium]